jgi:hypothetical protein
MKKILIMGWALLLFSTFAVGWARPERVKLDTGTRRIVEMASPLLEANYSLTLKWSGKTEGYASESSFRELFNTLTHQLEMNTSSSLEEVNGLPVLRSLTHHIDGSEVQCILAGSEDQQSSYFIMKLQTNRSTNLENLIGWQLNMASKLSAGQLKGAWNTMIQGAVKDQALKKVEPKNLLADISLLLEGHPLEQYTDARTESLSFYSPMLGASVQSGQHRINAQAALHQDSVSHAWRLTLGTPLITMEY